MPGSRPNIWRNQSSVTSSSSVEAGEVRQSIDLTSKAALSNSPKIPGAEVDVAKYAKNEGWLQWVSAGTIKRSISARIASIDSPFAGGDEGRCAFRSAGSPFAGDGRPALVS